MAVSSQERKLRPRRRAAPSPQARGINLLSAPWPGRGTGSRRGPGPRGRASGRRLEVRRAEKPGSQRPGAAGEAPAELSAEGGGASPRILRLGLLRRRGRRGPSRSPRPVNASQLVAGRRSRLGTVELITGCCVWLSSSWPSENALLWRRSAAPPDVQRSGASDGLRARRLAEKRASRLGTRRRAGGGCVLGAQAAAAPGKLLLAAQGVAPREGAAQVQLGQARVSAERPGAKRGPRAREGAPLPGKVSAKSGRRSEGGPTARCG